MERSLIPATLKIGRHWLPVDQIKRYESLAQDVIRVHMHGVDANGEPDYLDFTGEEASALYLVIEESAVDVLGVVRKAASRHYDGPPLLFKVPPAETPETPGFDNEDAAQKIQYRRYPDA